jgi:histidinol-phosphate aminotransferase
VQQLKLDTVARKVITNIAPYQPGKPIAELTREYGITDVIKLASNENPLGMGKLALNAIKAASDSCHYYPDGSGYVLKSKIAAHKNVDLEQITLGNGSDDIFNFVLRAFVSPNDEVIISQYAFAAYAIAAKIVEAQIITVKAKNWGHDLHAMAKNITAKTKVIFIANPNNPTGTWNPKEEFLAFMKQVPASVIVVVDQAYFEYIEHHPDYIDAASLIERYPNLIVTYTFSKAYGLAGLRIGYSIANAYIADLLNRVRLPFNVNSLGLIAATVSLNDTAFIAKTLQVNRDGMKQLEIGFTKLNLEYIPSVGNFISVDVKQDAQSIYQNLLKHGIIVRPIANYGMPTYLRVSVGLKAQNTRFLTALKSILAK